MMKNLNTIFGLSLVICILVTTVLPTKIYAQEEENSIGYVNESKSDSFDEQKPIPGADAPVSPTNEDTHLDITINDILTPSQINMANGLDRRSKRSLNVTYSQLLLYANQYVGLPYVWGGRYPYQGGFDCAGLVMWTYNNVAGTNFDLIYTNAARLYNEHCTPVSYVDARPGDLVFFRGTYNSLDYISHVGLYCGNDIMLNAGDPIGYDNINDVKRMDGQAAPFFFGRVKGVEVDYSINTGWIFSNGQWLYVDENGLFIKGWKSIDGVEYYFDNNGLMATGWRLIENNWYFFNDSGSKQTGWITVSGKRYYLNDKGIMVTGYQSIDGKDYYFLASGDLAVGWVSLDGKYYYFDEEGQIVKNQWIGEYYVDENGIWDTSKFKQKWILNSTGWWYRHEDGSYTTNDFEVINGQTYYFNAAGYMVTGWQLIEGKYYYFDASGAMAKDTWIGEYYVDENGIWDTKKFKPQWILNSTGWWYRHEDGSYTTSDFEVINGQTYYFNAAGYMVTGWQLVDDTWYYFDSSGAMKTGWVYVGNIWYYLDNEGKMLTGFQDIAGQRYYFNDAGYMLTGWQLIEGKYYYFNASGAMAKDTWIGDYYVDENGVWI
ncbi:NlpC/P60 family protein [uncultured Faecalicoccus sp.]|uniref:NlpC/P60 family protein n=1 Tax=uncultured Faecalicoccus sp. TaxID=1971760 RepID=UPI00258340CB|nr:NlpC/P60 family protein [uncultured Faecalicoccus sp.]